MHLRARRNIFLHTAYMCACSTAAGPATEAIAQTTFRTHSYDLRSLAALWIHEHAQAVGVHSVHNCGQCVDTAIRFRVEREDKMHGEKKTSISGDVHTTWGCYIYT